MDRTTKVEKEKVAKERGKMPGFRVCNWRGALLMGEICALLTTLDLVTTVAIVCINVGSKAAMAITLPFSTGKKLKAPIDSLFVMSKLLAVDHTLQTMHLPK